MYKYFNKILFAGVILILASCDKHLDIKPEGLLTENQVFNSAKTSELALGAVYYNFMVKSKGIAYMYGDITTNNIQRSGKDVYKSLVDAEYAPHDGYVSGWWSGLYSVINLANNFINKATKLGNYEEKLLKQHIAEAKFIRAICYLNLLKYYGDGALTGQLDGMGVPLQLKEYDGTEITKYIPRSTNGDVYKQIILDLNSASLNLPGKYSDLTSTAARATKGTANALLARVYLYTRQYKLAAKSANEVISSKIYSLEKKLRVLFPTNPLIRQKHPLTKEDIFNLPISANTSAQFTNSTNKGKNNIFYQFTHNSWVSDHLIQSFEPKDNRKLQLIIKGWTRGKVNEGFDKDGKPLVARLMTYKFSEGGEENIPQIRLAEVILTRAEAIARTDGANQESVDLLNQVRSRAIPTATPLKISDFVSKETLIERILLERRLELMFENHERYDLIRTGRKDQLVNPNLPDNRLVMPIPQSEVEISNGIIKQNVGYN